MTRSRHIPDRSASTAEREALSESARLALVHIRARTRQGKLASGLYWMPACEWHRALEELRAAGQAIVWVYGRSRTSRRSEPAGSSTRTGRPSARTGPLLTLRARARRPRGSPTSPVRLKHGTVGRVDRVAGSPPGTPPKDREGTVSHAHRHATGPAPFSPLLAGSLGVPRARRRRRRGRGAGGRGDRPLAPPPAA